MSSVAANRLWEKPTTGSAKPSTSMSQGCITTMLFKGGRILLLLAINLEGSVDDAGFFYPSVSVLPLWSNSIMVTPAMRASAMALGGAP